MCVARPAFANGRFPRANQLVIDPSDPKHMVARATFGLMVTEDGSRWDWVCEQAVGFGDYEDPSLAMLKGGTLLSGTFKGLATGPRDACTWPHSGPLGMTAISDVSAERADPSHGLVLTSVTTDGTVFTTQVWTSDDAGKTWTKTPADLPKDFLAFTLDAAPSNPQRLYVTGRHGTMPEGFPGALARSMDRGATWDDVPIPGANDTNPPYLSAIDPNNPDTLYVRIDSDPTDSLIVSHDAGVTWTKAYLGKGDLLGFALSPDGATVLVGGPKDGIMGATAKDLAFSQVSPVKIQCLTWTGEGLYACSDEVEGFEIGVSKNGGKTFAPVMHLQNLCGPVPCPAGTTVATTCGEWWGTISYTIAAQPCDATGADAGTTTGGGTSSCGCRTSSDGSAWPWLTALGLGASAILLRRRRR